MAHDGVPHAARRHRGRRLLAVTVAALALLGACALTSQSLLELQHAAASTTGGRLARLAAAGATWATAWPGWVAAGFFGVAALRVRRGAPEPPAGRTPLESMSLAQMRRGLLREYTGVRIALVVLGLVALLDTARAARYVVAATGGDGLARATLAALLVEALGLVAAAATLGLWAAWFRAQLHRLGALH
ncbi:MAG: hypothetical protein ACYDAC_05580 [Candidatus Dormibacteria bacterium]